MRDQTFRVIEDILRDYPDYDRHIAARRQKIFYPDNLYSDENMGGSSSGRISKPTEQIAMTIAIDKELQLLQYQRDAVERVINHSDPITNKIVREYYFTRPRTKTWEGIALDMNMSASNCRKLRNGFFERVADEIGLMK